MCCHRMNRPRQQLKGTIPPAVAVAVAVAAVAAAATAVDDGGGGGETKEEWCGKTQNFPGCNHF